MGRQTWEAAVLDDFKKLRDKGVNHPHMSEIEKIYISGAR
jgi:hypothetical protein